MLSQRKTEVGTKAIKKRNNYFVLPVSEQISALSLMTLLSQKQSRSTYLGGVRGT